MTIEKQVGYDGRLDRIEAKIDRLGDAMIDLARAEEKLITVEKFNQNTAKTFSELSKKIYILEKTAIENAATIKRINWFVVALATSILGGLTKYFVDNYLG